ncbi:MAG: PHB depolymerase family esterase [Bacteroidota bacterium]
MPFYYSTSIQRVHKLLFLLTLSALLFSCNREDDPPQLTPSTPSTPTPTQVTQTFNYNGLGRQYTLFTPTDLPPNAPLVFMLHGYQGRAVEYIPWVGLNTVAQTHGFAVCYPQGSNDTGGTPHWNSRLTISQTDDIGFLTALAEHLQQTQDLDPNRTFSCGFSNGGFMSYTMACERPGIFRAIGSVTGTMSGYTWRNRDSTTQPTPILQISGINDNVVPINGSMSTFGGWGGAPHMDSIMNYWANFNQTQTSDTSLIGPNATGIHYQDGVNDHEVWYYKIKNFGHEWPQTNNNAGFSAAELLWEFFSQFE